MTVRGKRRDRAKRRMQLTWRCETREDDVMTLEAECSSAHESPQDRLVSPLRAVAKRAERREVNSSRARLIC
jgi:hypothetical protein